MKIKAHWEHYPHEADMGIRGYGHSINESFEQAGHALTAIIVNPKYVEQNATIAIKCTNPDIELLFVDWINALIYEMSVRKMLFSGFHVGIKQGVLSAEVRGEAVDVKRHQPAVEIKGATYTTLKVAQLDTGEWMAQTVVDV